MPFWYQLPIPTLGEPQPATVRITEWLIGVGDEVHRGTRIAVIEAPIGRYVVLANGDGVLRERHFPAGAEIGLAPPIAVIATDGESLPYGRPYSLGERLEESASDAGPPAAKSHRLPAIADCYAMNVTPEGEVWLNYYTDFPLVRLRGFALADVWQCFHPMGKAFAVVETDLLYLHDGSFKTSALERLQEQQTLTAIDEEGVGLSLNKETRPAVAARGSSLIVKTETALYELIS